MLGREVSSIAYAKKRPLDWAHNAHTPLYRRVVVRINDLFTMRSPNRRLELETHR
jgi:hypothetical protein